MSVETDTRDRVIRLEADFQNLEEKVSDMSRKVTQMHEVLMQAKGARYVIVAAAAIGGSIAGFLVKFIPWTANLPR